MASSRSSSTTSFEYDVYLSFRGEDSRKTFVDYLYSSLVDRLILTYKDDVTLSRGESIAPSLFKAIEGSRIAIIIFSKNYASSSWCLEELAHIMKCREERALTVMPIFYDVDPLEVRKQKGNFGKAFAQHGVENITKVQLWRKALFDASAIAGWELKQNPNRQEMEAIKEIVDVISDRLFSLTEVWGELVGMRSRLQDLELQLDIGSGGVRMVGIWGMGGSGKTTLATSVCMKFSHYFEGHCILANIGIESRKMDLKQMQENMLSTLLKKQVKLHSVMEGKNLIKSMLCHTKVLVLLDDVDNFDQLEALAGSRNWFGNGSRIIITSRDEHLLRTHKIDKVCHVRLLSHDEAIQLFNKHAYDEEHPINDYETLSSSVVSYAAGLPLALKVLGSFLHGKDKKGWLNTLERLRSIPTTTIMEKLRISYDGLESYLKELFLDIACFWRGESKDKAMEVFEACGYHPKIGIEILTNRALIFIDVNGKFDMHDLVQEMGHYIVRGSHPINPEKHSRVWIKEEIKNMCFEDTTMENDKIEAMRYNGYSYDHSSRFCNIVSNMKKLRMLKVNMEEMENEEVREHDGGPRRLSNLLWYIDWEGYPASPFPHSFQLRRLVVLKLDTSKQKEVWKGCKHLPLLKVLELRDMNKLLSTPDFDGLPCLQKLILCDCDELKEIHPSLGNHASLEYVRISYCPKIRLFPTIVHMQNLKTLKIDGCGLKDGEIPYGISKLSNLQELDLSMNNFSHLDLSLYKLTQLKVLNLSWCDNLVELPEFPSSLSTLKADYCNSLTNIGDCFRNCEWLYQVSLMGGSIINDAGTLLEFMLEGVAFENCSMLLQLKDLSIPNGTRPPLLKGSSCRLELPDNWGSDFSGFLMCAVFLYDFRRSDSVRISMNEVMSGMHFEDDVVWKESDNDKSTWLWYVSFASLRDSAWWDQAYKSVSFKIHDDNCSGFTARLVRRKNRGDQGLGDTPNYFKVEQDSKTNLVLSLSLHDRNL